MKLIPLAIVVILVSITASTLTTQILTPKIDEGRTDDGGTRAESDHKTLHELRALREQVRRLSNAQHVQGAKSAEGNPADSVPSEPARPAVTRRMTTAHIARLPEGTPIAAAADRFKSEKADRAWAVRNEQVVRSVLSGMKVPADRIRKVECRATICQVELKGQSVTPPSRQEAAELFEHGLLLTDHESVVPSAGSGEEVRQTLFFERALEPG